MSAGVEEVDAVPVSGERDRLMPGTAADVSDEGWRTRQVRRQLAMDEVGPNQAAQRAVLLEEGISERRVGVLGHARQG